MSVTAIRLKNFMGFEDTDWIELCSICLLFGANSSGKSAIIRALRLLKQSLDADEKSGPLIFAAESGADLGTFEEMIRGHLLVETHSENEATALRQMVFAFRCSVPAQTFERIVGPIGIEEQSTPWETELSLCFQCRSSDERVELSAMTVEIPVSPDSDKRQTVFEWLLTPDITPGWYLGSYFGNLFNEEGEELIELRQGAGFLPTLWSAKAPANEKAISDRCVAIIAVFEACLSAIKQFLGNIRYLGPIRFEPQRYYFLPQMAENRLEQQGAGTLRDYLMMSADSTKKELLEEVNYWIRELGLGDYVEIKQLSSRRFLVCQILFGNEVIHEVAIRDVGYGVSQALPIVLQSLFAPPECLVIIEQPEVHLHPKAQVALTDLFIKQTADNRRFLIETHSEHILLRTQRRIAETTYEEMRSAKSETKLPVPYSLDQNQFRMIFVRCDGEGSFTEFITSDKWGELEAPSKEFQYFFNQAYDQVASLARVQRNIKDLGVDDVEDGN